MLVFAAHGDINWILGGILSVGSIAGGMMGARLSLSANAKRYVFDALYIGIFPGLAIMLTVLGFNLAGDGLRDALDPSTRN